MNIDLVLDGHFRKNLEEAMKTARTRNAEVTFDREVS